MVSHIHLPPAIERFTFTAQRFDNYVNSLRNCVSWRMTASTLESRTMRGYPNLRYLKVTPSVTMMLAIEFKGSGI